MLRVVEIDPDDDAQLARFVDFENAHRGGRRSTPAGRREFVAFSDVAVLGVVERDAAWIAVFAAARQTVDGGRAVHILPAIAADGAHVVGTIVDHLVAGPSWMAQRRWSCTWTLPTMRSSRRGQRTDSSRQARASSGRWR